MSFKTPGWRPVSSTILAAPSTVCAASCCAMSRGRPACTYTRWLALDIGQQCQARGAQPWCCLQLLLHTGAAYLDTTV